MGSARDFVGGCLMLLTNGDENLLHNELIKCQAWCKEQNVPGISGMRLDSDTMTLLDLQVHAITIDFSTLQKKGR